MYQPKAEVKKDEYGGYQNKHQAMPAQQMEETKQKQEKKALEQYLSKKYSIEVMLAMRP